ncbi:hypothetical protein BGX34_000619 [Mortierella sp. NVP85]|nr:hypothetical protein BGX34_000619 [Mortierella sp. NVP85]
MSGYLTHHRHQQMQTQNHPVQQPFEQDMSAAQPSSLDPTREGYEWEQETGFCPGPIAPALSLDILLGMGPSQTAVPIATSPSMTPSSPGMMEEEQMYEQQQQQQQQHTLSPISLVSFSNEYPSAPLDPTVNPMDPYKQQEFAMSLSSIPPSPSVSVSMPQHQQLPTVTSLPQQYYYELLMAANPNQPLSQLLSTSATAMATQPFTVTSSSIPSPDMTSTYAVLESSTSVMVSSSSIPDGTPVDSSTSGLLTPVAPAYTIEGFPVESESQQPQQQQQEQQTIPLTTKEIMDALSGQFPIQPMTPSIAEPIAVDATEPTTVEASQQQQLPHEGAQVQLGASDEDEPSVSSMVPGSSTLPVLPTQIATSLQDPTAVVATIQSADSSEHMASSSVSESAISDNATAPTEALLATSGMEIACETPAMPFQQAKEEEQSLEEDDCHMMSPPPLCQHDEDKTISAVMAGEEKATEVSQEQPTMDMDTDMGSPPPSPTRSVRSSKRNSKGSSSSITRRTSHRPQTRRSRVKTEPENIISMEPHTAVDSTSPIEESEVGQRPSRVSKRRRASADETATPSATSSTCSSPESSPPSPKTPPPLSENQNAAVVHHHLQQVSLSGQENDVEHGLHHKHGLETTDCDEQEPPKRSRSQRGTSVATTEKHVEVTSGNTSVVMIVETAAAIAVDSESTKKEGSEDAGVLSSSLLTRYATRHSTRILRRSTTQAAAATAATTEPSGRKHTSVTSTSCASVSGSEPGLLNNNSRKATAA